MTQIRFDKLKEFSQNYTFELVKKSNGVIDLKVNANNGQVLKLYGHKDRHKDYKRICFYEPETKKVYDYGIEEIMAYIVGINIIGHKITKTFRFGVLIPALKEYFNEPTRVSKASC